MKYLLGAACLLLMGAGCMQTPKPIAQPNPPQKTETVPVATPEPDADTETETSTSQTIETEVFSLVVSETYQVETENYLRIQNFIGQDDPRYVYANNAFFIEITDGTIINTTEEEFAVWYETTTPSELIGTAVIKGEGRHVAGDGWPGHAYFEPLSKTIFTISYQHPEGRTEAEAILQNIEWK